MRIALKRNNIACIFWFMSIAAYMFQCYWRKLAIFIVPSLIIFLILEIPNIKFLKVNGWILIYGIYGFYLIFSTIVSSILRNPIGSILRFFLILVAIPIAGLVNEDEFGKEWMILKILALIKAGTILYTWCICFYFSRLCAISSMGKRNRGRRYLYYKWNTQSPAFRNKSFCYNICL